MHDDLGIATGVENMSECQQFGDQFLVVVDLPVEHHANALVFVVERLLTSRQVDDREPPVPQAKAWFDMQSTLIRATMVLRLVHPHEHGAIDVTPAPSIENSGYAAHGLSMYSRSQ
ncbi:MAG: hypothetical protein AW09_000756 [Candidatus Accumulibacter phosphatis]|uniref:Uncharacterized protein n=1 Tax=Candidatus Accumulibacter phosphatis TaxID=327160 RepID=A0A080LYW6_9PROT|nr:MAG: hypothetical protein AW09_000756 [Candidatus Accumulibacter phosphatis]